jgi:hypothetical protein
MSSQDASPPPKKKGVQFRGRNSIQEVQRISRLSHYSEEEIMAVWGDEEEFFSRKEELKEAAWEMEAKRRLSDDNFTRLGIADKVGKGRKEKKKSRAQAIKAVMAEQDMQFEEGTMDDELIAIQYEDAASDSREKARKAALIIHEEVKRISLEDT